MFLLPLPSCLATRPICRTPINSSDSPSSLTNTTHSPLQYQSNFPPLLYASHQRRLTPPSTVCLPPKNHTLQQERVILTSLPNPHPHLLKPYPLHHSILPGEVQAKRSRMRMFEWEKMKRREGGTERRNGKGERVEGYKRE